jgi:hypothetical protein
MTIYSYVIEHDLGFAPNPFHGVCTLACCKPKIRKNAVKGDYILGTGSVQVGLRGHLCFWMRVEDVLSFNEYWSDARFRRKRPYPHASQYLWFGDNIYHRDEATNRYVQENSYHSEHDGSVSLANLDRDTGTTDRVLLSKTFCYWGHNGKPIPKEFSDFVHDRPAHRCRFSDDRQNAFLGWLLSDSSRGLCGEPAGWQYLRPKRSRSKARAVAQTQAADARR